MIIFVNVVSFSEVILMVCRKSENNDSIASRIRPIDDTIAAAIDDAIAAASLTAIAACEHP